jgi:hypothetical protein
MHRHPFSGLDLGLIDDGPERGDETAAEACRRGKIQRVRQGDEIGVGEIHRDIFGKGTPGGEARLELVFAHLMIAGIALETMTAAADKGHGHTFADLPLVTCLPMARMDPASS